MAYYNLPSYQNRNEVLDFSPVENALAGYQKGMDQRFRTQQNQAIGNRLASGDMRGASAEAYRQGNLDAGMGIDKTRMAQEDAARQRERQQVEWFGAKAKAVMMEQNPAKRAAIWQNIIARHPDKASLTPEYLDPGKGPELVAAEAGQYIDGLERQLKQAQLAASGLQQQSARLDIQAKQRELDSPKGTLTELDQNKSLIYTDPRTGQSRVIREPQTGPNGPYKDAKQRADVEEGLRKEVTTASKNYNVINEAATALEAISKQPNAATDMAMVFSFMKILDPDSVVRETEYANAARAAGVPDRVAGLIERIQSGQFLTPSQRNEFLGVAKTLANSRAGSMRQTLDRYKGIAERNSVDPRNVLPDYPSGNSNPTATAAKYRAMNAQGVVIESDDGTNWRPAK